MKRLGGWRAVFIAANTALLAAVHAPTWAQSSPPSLRAGVLPGTIVIDGQLSEAAWESADAIEDFHQTDPTEGAPPSGRTRVQVLADARSIVIGILCEQS